MAIRGVPPLLDLCKSMQCNLEKKRKDYKLRMLRQVITLVLLTFGSVQSMLHVMDKKERRTDTVLAGDILIHDKYSLMFRD